MPSGSVTMAMSVMGPGISGIGCRFGMSSSEVPRCADTRRGARPTIYSGSLCGSVRPRERAAAELGACAGGIARFKGGPHHQRVAGKHHGAELGDRLQAGLLRLSLLYGGHGERERRNAEPETCRTGHARPTSRPQVRRKRSNLVEV